MEAARAAGVLGIAIESERIASCLTRDELAQAANVTPETLGDYIRGEREPSLARLRDIAAAMEVRPQDLLDRADMIAGRAARREGDTQANTGGRNLMITGTVKGDVKIEAPGE